MRGRRALGTLLAGLLLVAFGAALAAADRLKTSSETRTVPGESVGETTASCKGKAKAVSGGFENEFDPETVVSGGSPQPFQYRSSRDGKRKWTGATQQFSDDTGDVTTFAYCRAEKLKAASKSTSVDGTSIGSSMSGDYSTGAATAKCPQGMKAVSGGFDNPDFDNEGNYDDRTRIIPYASRRRGARKWKVEAANFAGTEGTLVAHVYCHEDEALDKKKKSVTFSAPLNEAVAGEAVAKCPKRQRVVSGGFDLGGFEGDLLASKKRGGRKWQVSASAAFPETTNLTVFAYCEDK